VIEEAGDKADKVGKAGGRKRASIRSIRTRASQNDEDAGRRAYRDDTSHLQYNSSLPIHGDSHDRLHWHVVATCQVPFLTAGAPTVARPGPNDV
jgi:hypothetical protein